MPDRIGRKEAISIGDAILEMLRHSRIRPAHNTRRIFEAWDAASGAGPYTVRKFFRDGTLYITVNSSVVAMQLGMQKDVLLQKINAILAGDRLFLGRSSAEGPVKQLRIK